MSRPVRDPFEKIEQVSVTKVDYWVDELTQENFDADKVAELFFATKKESEISSTLSKIAMLQDNIEKILRGKVTSNYMTFIKARDTIKQTGLEMSELRALVDKTSELIQDVRNNRLNISKDMRDDTMMAMVDDIVSSSQLGADLMDGTGSRRRSDSNSTDNSSNSNAESMDNQSLDSDGEYGEDRKTKAVSKVKHEETVDEMLEEYVNSADPYSLPDWMSHAPHDMDNLIVERSYSAAVKLVMRVRQYADVWDVKFARDRDAYKTAKERGETENMMSLHGLSKEERNAAVSKQNKVVKIVELIETKQQTLAHTLMDSMKELPHSPIWGMEEQRRRLRLLITLGYHPLAAEAFSKSRMNIIQVVLRDVEASGDPKIYITDICKGFYHSMLDVTLSFLQLFSEHVNTPSIMNSLIVWAHHQTSELVQALMQQIHLAAKEYSTLAIIHMKPKISSILSSKGRSGSGKSDSKKHPLIPSSPTDHDDDESSDSSDSSSSRDDEEGSVAEDIGGAPVAYSSTYSLEKDLRSFVGPLKFARDCINIAFVQASEMNMTGLQGFADLSWLMLPQLKKLVNSYGEDLIKETINQVRLDSWLGLKPRVVAIVPPATLLRPHAANDNLPMARNSDVALPLGTSFDWLTVCLTHFIDDIWALLRVEPYVPSKANGPASRAYDSDDDKGVYELKTTYVPSEDEEGSSEEELDERSGAPKYKNPGFKRVGFSDVEPVAVTIMLRLVMHYVLQMEKVDLHSDQFTKHTESKKVFLDTCKTLREVTIPSMLTFIQDILLNLRMVAVLGNIDEESLGLAPRSILEDLSAKVADIESKVKA